MASATYQLWTSQRYTRVPSLLNLHTTCHPIPPLSVVTEPWVLALASHSKFAMGTYFAYGNVCVSKQLSQVVPPSASPQCIHKLPVCIWVSTAALQTGSSAPSFQAPYIWVNIPHLSFSFWLTSLCVTGSRLIHFVRTDSKVFFSFLSVQFSSVRSLSHVRLFATPWTAEHQASLSITNSQSLLRLMFIALVMPYNQLILYHPLFLPTSIFPSVRVFSNESILCIRWPKYWSFSFSISPSNEYSGLISFKTD